MKNQYALKFEFQKPKEDEAGVELEINVLKLLLCNGHFLRYIDSGKMDGNDFLIMQLARKSLSDLRKLTPKKSFTLSTAMMLAQQTMEAVEVMHGSGLVHRDIKPANFTIGYLEKESRNIYLLDFGLVRQFQVKDGTIRAPRPKTGFKGTVKYASINCHKNLEQCRHDDLCSWLYMMFEFLKGDLPWQMETDKDKVLEIKEKSKSKLLENVEPEFARIYDHLLTLTYFDEPPYHTYRSSLWHVMQRKDVKSSEPYDWEPGGRFFQEMKSAGEKANKEKGSKGKNSKSKDSKGKGSKGKDNKDKDIKGKGKKDSESNEDDDDGKDRELKKE